MAGPSLELFRFAVYLFFPVGMMYYYGNPEWYFDHVLPFKEKFYPPKEAITASIPHNQTTLRQELDRIRAERLAGRRATPVQLEPESKRLV